MVAQVSHGTVGVCQPRTLPVCWQYNITGGYKESKEGCRGGGGARVWGEGGGVGETVQADIL